MLPVQEKNHRDRILVMPFKRTAKDFSCNITKFRSVKIMVYTLYYLIMFYSFEILKQIGTMKVSFSSQISKITNEKTLIADIWHVVKIERFCRFINTKKYLSYDYWLSEKHPKITYRKNNELRNLKNSRIH